MRIFAAIKQNLKQNKNLDIKFIVEITDKQTGERSTYEI